MQRTKLSLIMATLIGSGMLGACSSHTENKSATYKNNLITVDIGSDIATLDPQKSEDAPSHRVINDLFEGLTSYDQNVHVIPGLAEKWDISKDGKVYTFYLRPNIKFSDGSPITADDVVFTFRRLADPKTASPYNFLVDNLVNGKEVRESKYSTDKLGIKALNASTVQITLNNPDASFLSIVSLWNFGIVSKANLNKFNDAWTHPQNMVTSGAYQLTEQVVNGYILENKNPNYYDAANVAIEQVKLLPISDSNSALSQYKAGNLDITYTLPIDQYKNIKSTFGPQEHTIVFENIAYYDFNMSSTKFKNNPELRQALSMAVDRNTLVKDVLGQEQQPLYSYVTSTIEGGKFAGINYEWASWPRDKQISKAQELFKAAGYGPNHPFELTISYNTLDQHKKNALAIASMWRQTFGEKSIKVTLNNQEFKTFLQTRHKGDYDIARDGWTADYDSVDSYLNLYTCNGPQNNSHSCTDGYNELVNQALQTSDAKERENLNKAAIKKAMDDYAIIPLFQNTYYRLVNPRVKGYEIESNHLDHVMSKWYKF